MRNHPWYRMSTRAKVRTILVRTGLGVFVGTVLGSLVDLYAQRPTETLAVIGQAALFTTALAGVVVPMLLFVSWARARTEKGLS